jgi:hypothetical protein
LSHAGQKPLDTDGVGVTLLVGVIEIVTEGDGDTLIEGVMLGVTLGEGVTEGVAEGVLEAVGVML